MTFNAASRLPSLEDRSAALGSSRCELPGMHSVPKSAVLPYASGVGGLGRRLLNILGSLGPKDLDIAELRPATDAPERQSPLAERARTPCASSSFSCTDAWHGCTGSRHSGHPRPILPGPHFGGTLWL